MTRDVLLESEERRSCHSDNSSTPNFDIVNVMAPPMPLYAKASDLGKSSQHKGQISFFSLYRYAKPIDVFLLALGMLTGIGTGIMMPIFFLFMGDMIDAFSYDNVLAATSSSSESFASGDFTNGINSNAIKLLYIGVINCVFQFLVNFTANFSAQRQCNAMRKKFIENAISQEIGWFDASQTGALTAVVTDIQQIQSGIGTPVCLTLSNISTFVSGFVVAFVKGWKMALVVACIAPLITIVGGVVGGIVGNAMVRANVAQEEAGKVAEEIISCVRTVTAFSIQDKALERYNAANKEAKKAGYTQGKGMGTLWGSMNFAIFGVSGLAFWYGSTLVTKGEMSTGSVLVVFMSVLIGTMSLSMVSSSARTVIEACGAGYEVFKVIDRKSSIDPRDEGGLKVTINGNIEFKDVTFRYPTRPETVVLKSFSLKIKKGRTVAFVGSSGSGKSTVVGLLERFYDLEGGALGRCTLTGTTSSLLTLSTTVLRWALSRRSPSSLQPPSHRTSRMATTGRRRRR